MKSRSYFGSATMRFLRILIIDGQSFYAHTDYYLEALFKFYYSSIPSIYCSFGFNTYSCVHKQTLVTPFSVFFFSHLFFFFHLGSIAKHCCAAALVFFMYLVSKYPPLSYWS